MTMDIYPRLLGDIGGTNARFAWQSDANAPLSDVRVYACQEHPTLQTALARYISEHQRPLPRGCALGIATPVLGDEVRMTNHHWQFSIRQLQASMGFERMVVINDFAALALALPALNRDDLVQIGGGQPRAGAPMAVIGPGTGLGVSGLMRAGSHDIPLRGEGGHVTLAPNSDLEAAVIDQLRARFGHASAERALSGPGLVNLYEALCELRGEAPHPLSPAELVSAAQRQSLPLCEDALGLFFAFLGSTAGNLALTLGAHGGVYLAGGILPRVMDELRQSRFRERFDGKGRLQGFMQQIPCYAMTAQVSPALLGASRALDRLPQAVH